MITDTELGPLSGPSLCNYQTNMRTLASYELFT